jgi:lipopolysaccharide transport system permease protein
VAYSASLIPENWQLIYQLNPMAMVIQGSRWALLGAEWQPTWLNGLVVLAVLILLVAGAFYFRRVEQNIVDSI